MPRQIPESQLESIVRSLAEFDRSVSLEELSRGLRWKADRRTLQRRLALLVRQGRVVASGEGPARRYHAPEVPATPVAIVREADEEPVSIDLSPVAKDIQASVRRPLIQRTPVGYNREFLDSYRPNARHYLPAKLRAHLHEIGKPFTDVLPAGTYAKQIIGRLLIDLSWNSSRLEGNTYSLLETRKLIEYGEQASDKSAKDAQMLLNHKGAINFLVDHAQDIRFNRFTILNLHALLADNLLGDPLALGTVRRVPVGIEKTVYHPPSVPQIIEECFQQVLDTAEAIDDPFEQSFFVLVHLPYVQPFQDVNKRVARLAANVPLIRENLVPLSFVDVPRQDFIDGMVGIYELNRYELLRDVFVWAYERSCASYRAVRQELGEPDPMRLKRRALIAETIVAIVRRGLHGERIAEEANRRAEAAVPDIERARFIDIVVAELVNLHEGNIARYQITLHEFRAWRAQQHVQGHQGK